MPHHDPQDSGLTQPGHTNPAASLPFSRHLAGAALLQAEVDAIAWELSLREDLDAVPEVVQEFLFRTWTRVLAHVRINAARSEPEPHPYETAVGDLLWSVKPDVTLRQPTQLLRRVPPLLATLREGLSLLGEEAAHDPFFAALMKLHGPVLKLRRAKSRRDAAAGESTWSGISEPTPLLPAAGEQRIEPCEGASTGFEPTMSHRPEPLSLVEGEAPTHHALVPGNADAASCDVETLREGDWVHLQLDDRRVKAQLGWVSGNARFFLFVSEGGRQHSMTRRVCERLLREGLLVRIGSSG